nr:MAG TPA: hypothetical protein [Caudoviricetes sp.]
MARVVDCDFFNKRRSVKFRQWFQQRIQNYV